MWEDLKWDELTHPSRTVPCACGICTLARFKFKKVENNAMTDITNTPVCVENPAAKNMSKICPKCF